MKRTFLAAIMVFSILSLTACGHDHNNSPQIISTSILSDPAFDGDISVNATGTTTTVTQGNTQSVFAGINSVNTEFRAFLDFPLTGPGGVPGNAVIDSAFLDIVINSIPFQSGNSIPIRIELVSFQPPTLLPTDFDRIAQPPITFITIVPPISQADIGNHVSIDVTSLMIQAQNLGVTDFQVRILEDLIVPVSPGLIEITDTTGVNRGVLAPLLQVNYF